MAISSIPSNRDVPAVMAHSNEADNQLLARMRLVLVVSALLVAVVDHTGPGQSNTGAVLVLSCYAAVCGAAYAATLRRLPWARGKLMHRLDAFTCAALAATGSDADVFTMVFLFFAIVVASLRYGLEEGAFVTLGAVVLYCEVVIVALPGAAPARVFLRAAVLLAFGRAIAQLGERHIQAVRRQALLGILNQVANPRFGIDRTMTAALERIRASFGADRCFVVLEDRDAGRYAIRQVRAGDPPEVPEVDIDGSLARPMLQEPNAYALLYVRPWRRWPGLGGLSLSHAGSGRWIRQDDGPLQELAQLLEAGSFISAPVVFGRGRGRIYVAAGRRRLERSDALLLERIAGQELVAIDRIGLLDRIASDAAALERKKIALDLHDTAIQSYIGLQLGLAALCRQASPSNPLAGELDKLAAMASDVIVGLRDYTSQARCGPAADEPICLAALRRQAAQANAAYGIEVHIEIEGTIGFGDRLTAEVLQIVREGISNVCRHTSAKRAGVALRCTGDTLRIEINNEHGAKRPPPFRPRSISERAAALGGSAFVREGRFNDTIVCVEIPL
jgi:signal transduction histidine kinase